MSREKFPLVRHIRIAHGLTSARRQRRRELHELGQVVGEIERIAASARNHRTANRRRFGIVAVRSQHRRSPRRMRHCARLEQADRFPRRAIEGPPVQFGQRLRRPPHPTNVRVARLERRPQVDAGCVRDDDVAILPGKRRQAALESGFRVVARDDDRQPHSSAPSAPAAAQFSPALGAREKRRVRQARQRLGAPRARAGGAPGESQQRQGRPTQPSDPFEPSRAG